MTQKAPFKMKIKLLPDPRPANVSLSAAADYDVMGAAAAVYEPPHFRADCAVRIKNSLSPADVLEMII
ncbi:hypothetical protein J4732_18585 [Serratia marcescens]|uniref:Uncharacterized protein n=1 Tax=Serratia marcescens TaxID=615 RepID=A0A939NQT8_SERMA|nr:hypothetical protein [Serratia marcescens]